MIMSTVGVDSHDEDADLAYGHQQQTYMTRKKTHDIITMRNEVSAWIGGVIGMKIPPGGLMEELRSGVKLLHLAKSLHIFRYQAETKRDIDISGELASLTPDEVGNRDARRSDAQVVARQRTNIAKFLDWGIEVGVKKIILFESEDIVMGKNERQVLNCLMNIGKIFAKYGIEPPDSVKEEIENETIKRDLAAKEKHQKLTEEQKERNVPTEPISTTESPSPQVQSESDSHELVENKTMLFNTKTFGPEKLDSDIGEAVLGESKLYIEGDMVVIDDPAGEFQNRKEIVTEVGDMVVIDTVELTANDNVIRKDNGRDVTSSDSEINENNQSRYSTSDTSTVDETSRSTSENEYYTAYDVTNIDDITSLMYNTAYVDDVTDDEQESDRNSQSGAVESDHEGIKSSESSEVASNVDGLAWDGYVEQDAQVSLGGSDSPRHTSSASAVPYSDEDVLNASDHGILNAASTYRRSSDEVMINFPPAVANDSFQESFSTDSKFSSRAFSSTPSSSFRSSKHSANNSTLFFPVAQESPVLARKVETVALGTEAGLRQRTSSLSSRSSTRSGKSLIQLHRHSISGSEDPRSPLAYITTKEDATSTTAFTQTSISFKTDIVRIVDETGDIYTLSSKQSLRRNSAESSASASLHPDVAVLRVKTQHVDAQRSPVGRISPTRSAEGNSQNPIVLEPNSLGKMEVTDHDIEAGISSFPFTARQGSFKQIVKVADRFKAPIYVTVILLVSGIGGLIAMAIIFQRT